MKWEWYDDPNTFKVFIHLILTVSIEDSQWHGETIRRGSRVTSYAVLANELHLSIRAVRTSLNHLKTTGEVTVKKTNKYSIIAINNYDKFQEVTRKTTGNRQASDIQTTSNRQQYKKVKEDSKKVKEESGAFAQNSEDEIERLKAELRK